MRVFILDKEKITKLTEDNLSNLPICIAKTQYSISDNKDLLGNPKNYEVTVKNIKLYKKDLTYKCNTFSLTPKFYFQLPLYKLSCFYI